MSPVSPNSGILEQLDSDCRLNGSQVESIEARTVEPLDQLVEELTRVAEVEAAIHALCVTHMARCGLTSWDGGASALNFWCHNIDATLRWKVSTNLLEPTDPPVCLMSVVLGNDRGRVLYGSVVADLRGAGPLLLSKCILSLLAEALDYETE